MNTYLDFGSNKFKGLMEFENEIKKFLSSSGVKVFSHH